jgi:hypothetical protein
MSYFKILIDFILGVCYAVGILFVCILYLLLTYNHFKNQYKEVIEKTGGYKQIAFSNKYTEH